MIEVCGIILLIIRVRLCGAAVVADSRCGLEDNTRFQSSDDSWPLEMFDGRTWSGHCEAKLPFDKCVD